MKKRLAHTHFQKRKKKKNIPSSTTSPIQVVKFCSSVVVASNLFASTKIYLLLNQNCKEIAKRKKKTPHHLSLVGVSVLGLVRQILGLGFAWWLNSLSHYSRNPIFFASFFPFWKKRIRPSQTGTEIQGDVQPLPRQLLGCCWALPRFAGPFYLFQDHPVGSPFTSSFPSFLFWL